MGEGGLVGGGRSPPPPRSKGVGWDTKGHGNNSPHEKFPASHSLIRTADDLRDKTSFFVYLGFRIGGGERSAVKFLFAVVPFA